MDGHNPEITLHEYLFYGSVDVTFNIQNGTSQGFHKSLFSDSQSQDAKDFANQRFKPLTQLGTEYEATIIPAIPATDPVFTAYSGLSSGSNFS